MLSDAVELATSAPRDVLSSPGATVSHTALQEAICDLLPSITERGETIGRSLEGMLPFHRVKGTSRSLCCVESTGTVTQLELQLFAPHPQVPPFLSELECRGHIASRQIKSNVASPSFCLLLVLLAFAAVIMCAAPHNFTPFALLCNVCTLQHRISRLA
jgi:hypothetical protein